jgi:hypothetical protein
MNHLPRVRTRAMDLKTLWGRMLAWTWMLARISLVGVPDPVTGQRAWLVAGQGVRAMDVVVVVAAPGVVVVLVVVVAPGPGGSFLAVVVVTLLVVAGVVVAVVVPVAVVLVAVMLLVAGVAVPVPVVAVVVLVLGMTSVGVSRTSSSRLRAAVAPNGCAESNPLSSAQSVHFHQVRAANREHSH